MGDSAQRDQATAADLWSALPIPLAWKPALGATSTISGHPSHEATLAVDRCADFSPTPSLVAFFGVDDLLSLRGSHSPIVLDRARGRHRWRRALDSDSESRS